MSKSPREVFYERLEAQGVSRQKAWSVPGPAKGQMIHGVSFYLPNGSTQGAVIFDYGAPEDGFALFLEDSSNRIDDSVLNITSPIRRDEVNRAANSLLLALQENVNEEGRKELVGQIAVNLEKIANGSLGEGDQ